MNRKTGCHFFFVTAQLTPNMANVFAMNSTNTEIIATTKSCCAMAWFYLCIQSVFCCSLHISWNAIIRLNLLNGTAFQVQHEWNRGSVSKQTRKNIQNSAFRVSCSYPVSSHISNHVVTVAFVICFQQDLQASVLHVLTTPHYLYTSYC